MSQCYRLSSIFGCIISASYSSNIWTSDATSSSLDDFENCLVTEHGGKKIPVNSWIEVTPLPLPCVLGVVCNGISQKIVIVEWMTGRRSLINCPARSDCLIRCKCFPQEFSKVTIPVEKLHSWENVWPAIQIPIEAGMQTLISKKMMKKAAEIADGTLTLVYRLVHSIDSLSEFTCSHWISNERDCPVFTKYHLSIVRTILLKVIYQSTVISIR